MVPASPLPNDGFVEDRSSWGSGQTVTSSRGDARADIRRQGRDRRTGPPHDLGSAAFDVPPQTRHVCGDFRLKDPGRGWTGVEPDDRPTGAVTHDQLAIRAFLTRSPLAGTRPPGHPQALAQ